jgi:hypothetical protein
MVDWAGDASGSDINDGSFITYAHEQEFGYYDASAWNVLSTR